MDVSPMPARRGSRLSWSYMLWSLGSFSRSAESSTTFLSPNSSTVRDIFRLGDNITGLVHDRHGAVACISSISPSMM